MKGKWAFVFIGAVLLLAMACSGALATGKCGGADIANGPFVYTGLGVTQATLNGLDGASLSTGFSITAPSVDPNHQTPVEDLFPGEGQNPCTATANATIGVLEIQQVGDAAGNPIEPVDVDLSSNLGGLISGAFSTDSSSWTFGIGETKTVTVQISNPHVSADNYGDYDIKLAAQAPGYGIGVGNGLHFLLSLRAATASDTTPPVVTVAKPAGDEILGVIQVEIRAYDPDTPLPATGLASMEATVSSAVLAVNKLSLPLTLDKILPTVAGVTNTVTGTGSFIPVGGAGAAGTTNDLAFTSASPSGIGSYTINAQATDGAGNIGSENKSFKVNYNVAFTKQQSTNPCQTGGNGSCTGQFQFTVNRSSDTSDGAFMYDHTVVVELVRSNDNVVVKTHYYGTGDPKDIVKIDSDGLFYQTNFRRGDIGASSPTTYVARVYFLDVDSNLILQGTSNAVTF